MDRLINFSAGPAMLPTEILAQAQLELLDWQGRGYSILEANHRGSEFGELFARIKQDFRRIAAIPDDYQVLFLLAPARAHFAAIPLNLSQPEQTADYLVMGLWSQLAAVEAKKYLSVQCADSAQTWRVNPASAYAYITDNETVQGIQLHDVPDTQVPLVCDMTSSLLTRPIDVRRYGMFFAGVQKNIAPVGLSLVIIREDLLDRARTVTPSVLDYGLQAQHGSLLNTNNNFSIYMTGLMLEWIDDQGGLDVLWVRNQEKAQRLYAFIDAHDYYTNHVPAPLRSCLNVVFDLNTPQHEAFLVEARAAGMIGLNGHRSVGGMRVSLYNAVSLTHVDALIAFMKDFAERRG
jgi:phosphoserine aminotransferase